MTALEIIKTLQNDSGATLYIMHTERKAELCYISGGSYGRFEILPVDFDSAMVVRGDTNLNLSRMTAAGIETLTR